ncbi:DMT family transporter [Bacillus sp. 03113]|uniref:DMT family transporter n=1 Tax=Bacillus sp. 03113 TaxID=2578211 RepID=UPI001142F258|nr:DMT family transporter [Bacillus sp. 03113]
MKTQIRADFVMVIITIFWGSSYLFMKMGLDSINVFNLIALRFGIAFFLSAALFYKRLLKANVQTIKYAFILGSILFLVFATVTSGVKTTSASSAGFLVSLTVIFAPLLSSLWLKKKPKNQVIIGILLALFGIGLLTLNNTLQLGYGAILCILCALCNATHIVVTGALTKNVDSITLGVLQLGFTAVFGLLFSVSFETPKLPDTFDAWFAVLALGLLCSAIGTIGQTTAQKYTTPIHTSLIFSLEPVFAALFAFLFAGEMLSTRGYIGAAIVLIGVLLAEVDLKKLLFKKRMQNKYS